MLKEAPAAPMGYVIMGRNEFFKSKSICQVLPGAEYDEMHSYAICATGLQAPIGNALWQQPLSQMSEPEIDAILEKFKKKQLPFFWWEAPIPIKKEENNNTMQLTSTAKILTKRGFQNGGLLTGVAADLETNHLMHIQNKEITIRKVQTSEELSLFCNFIFPLHGMEPPIIEQMRAILKPSAEQKRDIHYLAFDRKQPVGGVTLAISQTAGLWNFATHPDRRNEGIGTALIQTALQDAHARGYQRIMAILMPGTTRTLWQRLHFQEVCRFPFHISPA